MEQLADSFCERCGTRYSFQPGPPKGKASGARLLALGLKNFVMADGVSMNEAMEAARIDSGHQDAIRVTEEFHKTFNFCMSCRQYACEKCWNENQGACLTCAPLWDKPPTTPEDHLIVRMPVSRGHYSKPQRIGARPEQEWPSNDLPSQSAASVPTGLDQVPPPAPTPIRPPVPAWPEPSPRPVPVQRPEPQTSAPEPEAEKPAQLHPIEQLRTPAWVSEQHQAASDELEAKSQAWKSNDDGWGLWPEDEETPAPEPWVIPAATQPWAAEPEIPAAAEAPVALEGTAGRPEMVAEPAVAEPAVAAAVFAAAEMVLADADVAAEGIAAEGIAAEDETSASEPEPATEGTPSEDAGSEMALTPEELQLIQAQLEHAMARSDPDRMAAALAAIAMAPEPASEPEPVAEVEPAGEAAGAEPPGSESQPIPRLPEPEPAAEAHRAVPAASAAFLLGGMLARRQNAAAETLAPAARIRADEPALDGFWPRVTRWSDRPVEQHDYWTAEQVAEEPLPTAEAAAEVEPVQVRPEPAAEVRPAPAVEVRPEVLPAPAPEIEPLQTQAEPAAEAPADGHDFEMPPASADPWPMASPDMPNRQPVEWPAADNVDRKPAEPAWPPLASPLPAVPEKAPAPWPMPQVAAPRPSVMAAHRADAREMAESPLVAALWEESSQQVMDRGNVRVCHKCALPVSTHARFCRRCGAKQEQD
jgi:ribosomal protein L40E